MRVVIAAAGVGSRLGLGIPKCLVEIGGKSLIRHQIEALDGIGKITAVAGFRHEMVASELSDLDARIVVNHRYETTSVIDSIRIGIGDYRGDALIVDGDVLFCRRDIQQLIGMAGDVVCVTPNMSSDNPVFVEIRNDQVIEFKRGAGILEWAGICKISTEYLKDANGFIYEALSEFLPMRWLLIDSVEIDTPDDLREAEKWIEKHG